MTWSFADDQKWVNAYTCPNTEIMLMVVKEIVKEPLQKNLIFHTFAKYGPCSIERHKEKLGPSYVRTREPFRGGPWEFNFYLTQKGRVLFTREKLPVKVSGPIRII